MKAFPAIFKLSLTLVWIKTPGIGSSSGGPVASVAETVR